MQGWAECTWKWGLGNAASEKLSVLGAWKVGEEVWPVSRQAAGTWRRQLWGAAEHAPSLMRLESPGNLVPVQTLMEQAWAGLPGEAGAEVARATLLSNQVPPLGPPAQGGGKATWCLEAMVPERPESPQDVHVGKDEAT